MSNLLGEYIKARRLELGLSRGQVARLLGYTNLSRGARRLCDAEGGRLLIKEFLSRLITLLGIPAQTVQELFARDRENYVREWEQWADEPVPISVVVRCIPGFMAGVKLPEDRKTPEQAIEFGQALAARLHKKVFVVLSRRETVGFTEKGEIGGRFWATPDLAAGPLMNLGPEKFLFHFDSIGDIESVKPKDEP